MLDKSDPIHKVTIIPRGMALGLTWSLPEDDRYQVTREELIAQITMALGGRLAEEIEFGDVTTGASNDFEKATELARRMVTQYGMSELGPIQYGRGAHQVFLGRDIGEERNYSEEVASKIDSEVRKIIESAYDNGKRILTGNWGKVERMVASLLEYETVEAEEVRAILDERPYDRVRERGSGCSSRRAERTPGERRGQAGRKTHALSAEDFAGTRVTLRALLFAAALVAAWSLPAANAAAESALQQTGALPHGGTYVIDPDTTVDAAAIALWFRAPGAGYDNSTPGIAELAATAAAVAPLASGKSLYALVHSVGGELNVEVYPDIVGIATVVPASAARRVVAAITAAYYAPAVDDGAVKTARANAAVLGVQQRYEADATLHDLLFKQIFAERAGALSAAAGLRRRDYQHLDRADRRFCQTSLSFRKLHPGAERKRRRFEPNGGYRRRRPRDAWIRHTTRRWLRRPLRRRPRGSSAGLGWPGSALRSPTRRPLRRWISLPIIYFAKRRAS